MKYLLAAIGVSTLLPIAGFAQDAAKGENDFKKCRSCHAVTADDGTVIVKGGKTGPNLYGVVGRQAGSLDGFSFGDSIVAAGEAGVVWDVEQLTAYVTDPQAWLKETLDDASAKSKMTFKLKKGAEDMAAYLATLQSSPDT
ncbi:MAG: c-type cytochrome [Pseudorhodobacter sp.]